MIMGEGSMTMGTTTREPSGNPEGTPQATPTEPHRTRTEPPHNPYRALTESKFFANR